MQSLLYLLAELGTVRWLVCIQSMLRMIRTFANILERVPYKQKNLPTISCSKQFYMDDNFEMELL